jgi:hypothetical protein
MVEDFMAALDAARTLAHVDDLARDLWNRHGAGLIADADAERVSAKIEEARRRFRTADTVTARPLRVPRMLSNFVLRRRRCVSPDRLASRARRRRLAYGGPMPPALAAGFTVGQLATLRIVADEMRDRGSCQLPLAAIAARAGVGVTTARDAIRLAAGDGLATIMERRRRGGRSLPNIVRIISRDWLAWIARGGGSKKLDPTDTKHKTSQQNGASADRGLPERRASGRDPALEPAPAKSRNDCG